MTTLFIDANIIIYRLESSAEWSARTNARIALLAGERPPILAVSRLSELECCLKPKRDGDAALLVRYQNFFNDPTLTVVELDREVVRLALDIRATHGLKTPDALQAASALRLGTGVTFLTNDHRFEGVKGLTINLLS